MALGDATAVAERRGVRAARLRATKTDIEAHLAIFARSRSAIRRQTATSVSRSGGRGNIVPGYAGAQAGNCASHVDTMGNQPLAQTFADDIPSGGVPVHPIYMALESMGLTSGRPPNSAASERDAMQRFWKEAGLETVETQVIRIPTAYSDFEDFWDSNVVPIGPQGKLIAGMSASARDELRLRLRDHLPISSGGRIVLEAFANSIKGRVPA